jgi:anti-sigma regulatory factor (Ser/Thr protein kinase)/anti-anti-sigma regulatory factor
VYDAALKGSSVEGSMSAPALRLEVSHVPTATVLSGTGVLNATTSGQLMSGVEKLLAEQPKSLIIDIKALIVPDRIFLTVFITFARWSAVWPGCRLAVCGATGSTEADMRRLGIERYVTLGRNLADATERLRQEPPTRRSRHVLLVSVAAVAEARQYAEDVCTAWNIGKATAAAQTVVSELVTNAVTHAGTPMELIFTFAHRMLYVAVRDQNPTNPRYRHGEPDHGYGLVLIEAFSAHWGHHPTSTGKVVWAAIRVPSAT